MGWSTSNMGSTSGTLETSDACSPNTVNNMLYIIIDSSFCIFENNRVMYNMVKLP